MSKDIKSEIQKVRESIANKVDKMEALVQETNPEIKTIKKKRFRTV